jgi:hypothetical protein
LLREFRRSGDDVLDLAVDLLQRRLVRRTALDQQLGELVDRVLLRAHLLDFFLRAVFRGVGHRVAAIAIGLHLEDRRPLAGARIGYGALAGLLDGQHAHPVDRLAGDAIGVAPLKQVGRRRGAFDRRAHGVFVVLDDVDDRQLPQGGHVEALVDLALVDGTVAEIGQADVLGAAVLMGEGDAGAERHLGADDAVAAVEILLLAEHVHGAALALGIAAAASGEFSHHALGIHPAGEHVAVVAIAGDNGILAGDRRLHADDDRLLADIEMAEAADQAHAVHLARLLLEAADQQHVAIVFEQFCRIDVGLFGPGLALGRSRHVRFLLHKIRNSVRLLDLRGTIGANLSPTQYMQKYNQLRILV